MHKAWRAAAVLAASGVLMIGAGACGGGDEPGGSGDGGGLSGSIAIDGSSTVFPFAQAAAEQFNQQSGAVKITVGASGTGGGFEKFCKGETDVATASRQIKADEEVPICDANGVSYSEFGVANDGIAIVTNPALEIDCLTTAQLKALWSSKSEASKYSDVDPSLPAAQVSLFGPGTDSGTFDFFTEEINGEKGDTRKDYQPSEDDNVLVQGVAGEENGLGYFGFSYFEQNQDKLNLVAVDSGRGCVKPSTETIQDGSYEPLSRPLFFYVSGKAIARPAVKAFMEYVLANHQTIAQAAQIVPMTGDQAGKAKAALAAAG